MWQIRCYFLTYLGKDCIMLCHISLVGFLLEFLLVIFIVELYENIVMRIISRQRQVQFWLCSSHNSCVIGSCSHCNLTWCEINVLVRLTLCCLWLKTKQRRELVGKTERTTSDKLRERRLKKRRQKGQRLQKEKREKHKAEKTARLGSMKNLMDTIATSKQDSKNKKKTQQSVSQRKLPI